MNFAIITYILHKKCGGSYYSYSPYIREMNIWLKQVQEVIVVAPLDEGAIPITEIFYEHSRLDFNRIPSVNFLSARGVFQALLRLPVIIYRIVVAMKKTDHIHLRCPGNIGLIGCLLQIFFPKKNKTAKYAGNWDPKAGQPWTYRLQKWLLTNPFLTKNMQVLVYGEWPGQTKNIKPFFTASFSEQEIYTVKEKSFDGHLNFLFVGNLVPGKHPLKAVQLVQELNKHLELNPVALEISIQIYGDGSERKMLEAYCRNEKLEGLVQFKGSRPLEELKEAYQKAHFVILPSQSEGWPKAIAEGMFFGCIPIATPVSCVPWMLGGGSRGILISENDFSGSRVASGQRKDHSLFVTEETVDKMIELIQNPEKMKQMSNEAKAWSQQYTLERFEAAIKDVLAQPHSIETENSK